MTVRAAGLHTPPPDEDGRAQKPLDRETVAAVASFIHARLSALLVGEPASDAERMASVLAYRVRVAVGRLDTSLRCFHAIAGCVQEWNELAEIARMWADHPDYQEDFGRTAWEFPPPHATHAVLTVRRGQCRCPDGMDHLHREEILPLEDLDKSPWNRIRLAKRLSRTGHYRQLTSTGSLAEIYEVRPCPATSRPEGPIPGALYDAV